MRGEKFEEQATIEAYGSAAVKLLVGANGLGCGPSHPIISQSLCAKHDPLT